ncbi:hypothetical protein GQ53DRAFT_855813 [Thozetella sp. PMI_491]|nr:hypothetical protein GQ53DRAFT_855813 [Thozetella sp. PMI_491]
MTSDAELDFLVVGAGPAGAALASFLGQNGLKGLVISCAPGTAETPRAHMVNPFALECLRDIGLEEDSLSHATRGIMFQSMRWCRSMVGEEYGKIFAWGSHPDTTRDTTIASPCEWIDLPQSWMEPILVKYASQHGFPVRFSTTLLHVERSSSGVVCDIQDEITKTTSKIRAKYLFGADGAKSTVARSQDFPFTTNSPGGIACNILLNADLERHMHRERHAQLHWIMKPDQKIRFGVAPTLRMVRPWKQWLLVSFSPGATEDPFKDLTSKSPELVNYVREIIGDDQVEVEILRLDPWSVRDSIAEKYSSGGNVFLLGDAAHRHPPSYGLGSNTCIQDAYNLAWKIAFVSRGLAGPSLLESYSEERQPIGASLVHGSNEQLKAHAAVWQALGMFAETPEEGLRQVQELSVASDAGAERREQLHAALEWKRKEGESLGLGMNHWYVSSAVYLQDEPEPRPALEGDPVVKIQISTYPGSRLPHAWLDLPTRLKMISTHDLAGHGSFCLFTGHGGNAWKKAVSEISASTGIPIKCYGIGIGLDYHDVYREWRQWRGVEDNGCVLVRPDRFVAWRSGKMVDDCKGKLLRVMNQILSRHELKAEVTDRGV